MWETFVRPFQLFYILAHFIRLLETADKNMVRSRNNRAAGHLLTRNSALFCFFDF